MILRNRRLGYSEKTILHEDVNGAIDRAIDSELSNPSGLKLQFLMVPSNEF